MSAPAPDGGTRGADAMTATPPARGTWREVFWIFLKLGITSFGGPVAHLGYFREAFVARRRWVSEAAYADLVALSQFLPGPASSQVGMALGATRAGIPGGIAAWCGFTLPSALLMIAFAYGVVALGDAADVGLLHGLKVVAVPVVAQAVWGMARTMAPDNVRATLALLSAALVLLLPSALAQLLVMGFGALIGIVLLQNEPQTEPVHYGRPISAAAGALCLVLFAALLIGLPILARSSGAPLVAQVDRFYRSGALIFGGGHVVLPLLQAAFVPQGWIGNDAFLAGYGAAQAVPGPLLSFSAYLGTVMAPPPLWPWLGGLTALAAIFLPSFLLIFGALPYWDRLARVVGVRAAMQGVNAAVVGLLLAALYDPVWKSAILAPADGALALAAFGLLVVWKMPPWLVVVFCGVAGATSHVLAAAA